LAVVVSASRLNQVSFHQQLCSSVSQLLHEVSLDEPEVQLNEAGKAEISHQGDVQIDIHGEQQ